MTISVAACGKYIVTDRITLYNRSEQKSISACTTHQTLRWVSYNSIRFHSFQPRTGIWDHHGTETEQLKTGTIIIFFQLSVFCKSASTIASYFSWFLAAWSNTWYGWSFAVVSHPPQSLCCVNQGNCWVNLMNAYRPTTCWTCFVFHTFLDKNLRLLGVKFLKYCAILRSCFLHSNVWFEH